MAAVFPLRVARSRSSVFPSYRMGTCLLTAIYHAEQCTEGVQSGLEEALWLTRSPANDAVWGAV